MSSSLVLANSAVSTADASVETTLELPQGTWIVRGDYTLHEATVGGAILQIDGVTVHTASSHGDTQGTSQSVLFGFREITATSAKTIIIKGIQGSQGYAGSGLIMATATRSVSAPAAKTTNNSSIVFFETPYEIEEPYTSMAWTSVAGQGDWANSGATTLVVVASTHDGDIGGNSSQTLKTRAADGSAEVTIIHHGGTSATRTVTSEQAFIECSIDGSFEYFHFRDSGNATIRQFRVIGYMAKDTVVPGAGDLCKILSEDSGYQMFRNGLTIQWTSSPAFITESSQVVNFPIPFASKPFKVVASTRFPSAAFNTHETMQTTSWNATSVTIFAQSITANFNPVYADIIAIGIAEVTDCPGNSGDPQGTKISNLPSATNLKDDDLFVISKENDNDEVYDASLSVTMEKLSNDIKSRMGPMLEISSIISWTKGEGSRHFMGGAGFEGSLVPAGTWALLYFPWTAYDGGGEDDNAWYHQKPIIMEASKGFDIRAWMASLGSASHYSGSNYTGHGIGFKISEYPA